MIVQIIIVLVVVVGLFLTFIATRPGNFCIQRSRQIPVPSSVVYAIINDLHQWNRWSPFEKLDPNMQKTFSGSPIGPGSSYAWNGNNRAGEGRLTIVESNPDEAVKMDLEFSRPFRCKNRVTFAIEPQGQQTKVSWIMEGTNNFVGKIFGLLMNMEKMVGPDFEAGLASLEIAATADAQKQK